MKLSRLELLTKVGSWSFAFFLTLAVVPLVVLPANYFHFLKSPGLLKFADYCGYLLFVCILGAVACFFLSRFALLSPNSAVHAPKRIEKKAAPRWARTLSWMVAGACSVFLLVFSYLHLNSAMDWDELDTLARMVSVDNATLDNHDPYHNANMFDFINNTRIHLLANLAMRASIGLVGVSVVKARVPALIFTALLIVCLVALTWGVDEPFLRVLLFLHVSTNHLILWYTHSARGYLTMMIATTLLFGYISRACRNSNAPLRPAVVFTLFIFPLFTHTFGGIFSGLFFISYLAWFYFNARRLNVDTFKKHQASLIAGSAAMPLVGAYLIKQALFLNHVGGFHSEAKLKWSELLLPLGGFAAFPAGYFLFAFLGLLLLFQLVEFRRAWRLESLFFVTALSCFTVLIPLVRAPFFEPRFLLGFVIPALVWVGYSLSQLKLPAVRMPIQGLSLVVLCAIPALQGNRVPTPVIEPMQEFHEFMHSAGTHLPKGADRCVRASGEGDQARFVENIYFPRSQRSPAASCPTRYQLHFARSWEGELPITPAKGERLQQLYTDGRDRFLYQVTQD